MSITRKSVSHIIRNSFEVVYTTIRCIIEYNIQCVLYGSRRLNSRYNMISTQTKRYTMSITHSHAYQRQKVS